MNMNKNMIMCMYILHTIRVGTRVHEMRPRIAYLVDLCFQDKARTRNQVKTFR